MACSTPKFDLCESTKHFVCGGNALGGRGHYHDQWVPTWLPSHRGPLLPIMPSTKGPYPSVNRCPKISKEQSLEIPFSPSIHPPTPPSSSLEFVRAQ